MRVRHQNQSALELARYLEQQPQAARVNYPGLASSPSYRRAAELFYGCGGCLSFELKGGIAAADSFIRKLMIPACAPSLGWRREPGYPAVHYFVDRGCRATSVSGAGLATG